jgi:proteasome lid subunit RPN8/RPN11
MYSGPRFRSPRDEERLKNVLAQVRNKSDGLEPVGWYHSHTRSEIFLTEDLDIHDRCFPDMWHVALVVRPPLRNLRELVSSSGKLGGSIHASASYHEFQLEPPRGGPTLPENEADARVLLSNGNSKAVDPLAL